MRKMISLLIAVCMIVTALTGTVLAEESGSDPYGSENFDGSEYDDITTYVPEDSESDPYALLSFDGSESVNITSCTAVEGTFVYEQRDDVKVLKLRRLSGSANYASIGVENVLSSSADGSYIFVTVRYYDEGFGYFAVRYNTAGSSDYAYSEMLRMTNTSTWKEYTFVLTDCVFAGTMPGGGDILFGVWRQGAARSSDEPVYIQSIKIEKGFPTDPLNVKLGSAHAGNIFDDDDIKELRLGLENKIEAPVEVKMNYRILDHDGNFVENGGEWNTIISPNRDAEKTFTVGVSRFGLYEVEITYTAGFEWGGVQRVTPEQTILRDFSVMNKLGKNESPNRLILTNDHEGFGWGDAEIVAQLYRDAGLSGVRDEYRWGYVEASKGVYSTSYIHEGRTIEDFPKINTDNGLEQMLILAFGNGLYMPGQTVDAHVFPDDSRYPGSEAGFLNYVEYITKRYGNTVKYYELWNEPDISGFNAYQASAHKYVDILKKVYQIVKKNAPESKVVAGAVTVGGVAYLDTIVAEGSDYFDAVSNHPYVLNGYFTGDKYKTVVNTARASLNKYGCTDKEILLTEAGISAYPEGGQWPTELTAGMLLVQMCAITQAEELADRLYLFQYINNYPNIPWADGTKEQRWGFVNHRNEAVPYSAHPAAIATAAYNKLVGNAKGVNQHISDADADGYRTYIYQFKRESDGKDVLMYWSEFGSKTLGIKLGTDAAESFDAYSNSSGMLHATDSVFTLTTSFEPHYLVGEFSDFQLTDPVIVTNGGRMTAVANDTITLTYQDAKGRNLRIEPEAKHNLAVAQTSDLIGGSGKVVIKTGNDFLEEEHAAVKLYDSDDHLVYDGLYHVFEAKKPVSLRGVVERYNENTSNRYVLKLTVENTTQGYPLSGKVTVEFTGKDGEAQTKTIGNLAGGSSTVLKFNLPMSYAQNVRNLNVNYEFEGIEPGSVEILAFPELNVAYAQTPPAIDGAYSLRDWTGSDWFSLNDAYAAQHYSGWTDPSEAGMEGTMLWDEENLYLVAEVTDNVFYQPYEDGDSWQGDSIQLGIMNADDRMVVDGADLAGTAAFTEIAIYRSASGKGKVYRNRTQFGDISAGVAIDCPVSVEKCNGKWIYRAAIPWTELFGPNRAVMNNYNVRVGLLLNDNDGTGRKFLEFCEGIASKVRPNTFTTATLTGGKQE